jgi:hypothetical protein
MSQDPFSLPVPAYTPPFLENDRVVLELSPLQFGDLSEGAERVNPHLEKVVQ